MNHEQFMNDEQFEKYLRDELNRRPEAGTPRFETTLTVAAGRLERRARRRRIGSGIAAVVAIAAGAFILWPSQQGQLPVEYLTEHALLESTAWVAPSDALLPHSDIDIYRDLPVLMEVNDMQEGTLL